MASLSKNKGSAFERKIANLFSARFAEYTGKSSCFRRNADSGSFFGASNKKRIETHDTSKACYGDIMTPPGFNFAIECKHYKTPPSFASILKQDFKTLDGWLEQAEQDAENSQQRVLLIMKFNNVPEAAVVKSDLGAIKYRGYSIVPLVEFLDQPDDYFFTK
jgi:hypothetical protein